MDWFDISLETLDFICENGGVFHFWAHSWKIEECQIWDKLNTLFRLVDKKRKKGEIILFDNTQLLDFMYESDIINNV